MSDEIDYTQELRQLKDGIVRTMVAYGGLTADGAEALLRQYWNEPSTHEELRLHETPWYWAMFMLFGQHGPWHDQNATGNWWETYPDLEAPPIGYFERIAEVD